MEENNLKNKKSEAALREERILEFWEENKIFAKSLNKKASPLELWPREFIFYEGPPTANGKPGIHHLIARAFKDAIPRYKTMRGYHVRRKGGWDTHGLPVELQIEKKLGLNSKKAIEEYGIAKFNQECKESVWQYLDVWNRFTERVGFWVDQENAYVTYHNDYIESVWNIMQKVHAQNLLYKDYKVVPWCPRCGTALSSHELAQGYEDVKDLSVYAKFKVIGEENTYILAWTTTPWTLLGNLALAVGENIDYLKVKVDNEIYILAKARLSIITEPHEILGEMKGVNLIGIEYEPLYPFFKNLVSEKEKPKLAKAFRVHIANFVTTEDGTGVVHTAVMYGQDDFELGTKIGLPKHHLVGLDGKFLSGTGIFEGKFVRDEEVAVDVIKDLAHRGLLYKKEKYEHAYPHCWRCHTALIYYARDSWYIKMSDSKVKKQLINENKIINWKPAHIRDGRFGEWLREIKDWAISRERYWGTPLPVWQCEKCKKIEVIGSIDELKAHTKKSGNKYFFMRHGEAENNVVDGEAIWHKKISVNSTLTDKGKQQVRERMNSFKTKPDIIISSPFKRTKETIDVVSEILKFSPEKIIFEDRIRGWDISTELNDQKAKEVQIFFDKDFLHNPLKISPGGENFAEMIKRAGNFINELEEKYQNKNILIISHVEIYMALKFILAGATFEQLEDFSFKFDYLKNAELEELNFVPIPHNENYELDLHKPYIDELELVCAHSISSGQACGGKLMRTKEVMDVWFDSGAMPFAQDHYPFENKKWVDGIGYPADYICEAIDQTRGWFYTLHAVGVLMGRGKAYKNVICLGHLLDAKGKKMSKSLGNIVEPFEAMDKYGVDTLRLWMYSINQPGESKNFDEKTVALLAQQVFGLLYNVLAFYELYPIPEQARYGAGRDRPKSKNVLDVWILERLDELIELSTKNLDNYKLLEPVRAIRDFIGDLSTWYLRRSRDRIKGGDKRAKQTQCFVLKTLAKLMAPFAPFTAEDVWLKLKNENEEESVHLSKWPNSERFKFGNSKVRNNMRLVREIVTLGLEARQKAGIKVRQPLSRIEVKNYGLSEKYSELIKDELNVKEIIENKNLENEVLLHTEITSDLKQEGNYREFVRAAQDIRKKIGLTPSDLISLVIETNKEGQKLIQKFEKELLKTILAAKIEFRENEGEEIKIDDLVFKIKIEK